MRYGTAILAGLLLLVAAYTAFVLFLPTKIVGIHRNGSYIDFLVENFPYTDQGK